MDDEVLIPSGGFRWVYANPASGTLSEQPLGPGPQAPPLLLANPSSGADRVFSARDEPDLHRKIARIEPTAQGVLAFASRHGWLGHAKPTLESWPRYVDADEHEQQGPQPSTATRLTDLSSDDGNPRVESLTLWQHEVLRFSMLVALWDLVRANRSGPLGQLVRWHEGPVSVSVPTFNLFVYVAFDIHAGDLLLASAPIPRLQVPAGPARRLGAASVALAIPEVFAGGVFEFTPTTRRERVETKEIELALFYLQHEVIAEAGGGSEDDELLRRWRYGDPLAPADFYLRREVNRQIQKHVKFGVPMDGAEKNGLDFRPDCLLGAAHLSLAFEMVGRNGTPLVCPDCGTLFWPNHGRRRFCSDPCRHRHRYQAGKTAKAKAASGGVAEEGL